ncbi:MAG: hypothetical protein ACLSVD_09215 [Eggerthellaceae bacterium]
MRRIGHPRPAWCEHISSETSQERPLFLALCSLLTIVIVLVSIQLGARSAILFGGCCPSSRRH